MPSLFARAKRSNLQSNLDTHTLEVPNLAKNPLRTASGQTNSVRHKTWSESLAVRSEDFVEKVKTLLKTKATNREVTEMADKHEKKLWCQVFRGHIKTFQLAIGLCDLERPDRKFPEGKGLYGKFPSY
jgi:hypothetical protein